MQMEIHDFYCLKCGQRSMSLPRKRCHLYGKFHLKSLYCPKCRIVVNHIEVRDQFEKEEFINDFKEGVYEQALQDSLSYGGYSSVG